MHMPSPAAKTYTNPVYPDSFPDPFVLRHEEEFFAFCTGHSKDGRVFGVLRSKDLVKWQELSGALEELPAGLAAGALYWAPEVTFFDGTFYLYYSVGNETLMEIRVATARSPKGPYTDSGRKLTVQDFAIDPHVFIDDDGSWHLFYATDFLEYSHIGTGTVVDRMRDPFTLAGDPRPVTRAKYQWQVYDPARTEKGGVCWHTVEGPFVMKRKGKYFEMFSGGNWQNITYGVGYAVSDVLYKDVEWTQQIDGDERLPLLHTIPGAVIGPGHKSVTIGPNGRELFCVYHRWQDGKRMMCIDRLDFAGGEKLFVVGPTFVPQPAPFAPSAGGFDEDFCDCDLSGLIERGWTITDDSVEYADSCLLVMSGGPPAAISRDVSPGPFELAVNLKVADASRETPSIEVVCGERAVLRCVGSSWFLELDGVDIDLSGFGHDDFHQFRMFADDGRLSVYIDGSRIASSVWTATPERVELVVRHATIMLDMIRYTHL
jgi:GH43 family beta-xylosidase